MVRREAKVAGQDAVRLERMRKLLICVDAVREGIVKKRSAVAHRTSSHNCVGFADWTSSRARCEAHASGHRLVIG